jgi:ABC-type amino acid transport substrate-binding protein
MRKFGLVLAIAFFLCIVATPLFAEQKDLLSPEESLWLETRNNTIVVYPAENTPPYSYKNSAGNPQGLAIDYLELIAEKIGVKIEYLTPRPLSQIMSDIQNGKGDVVAVSTPDISEEQFLIFTDNYLTSPAVIVVRKDYKDSTALTLNDFNGKRIAVVNGSALESYIRTNYPRVVVDEMTDDEVSLQQVVLGETDGAAMDIASLSYFLSKQILSSVKIAGNTGFEYKPAFGIPKDKVLLQSILEKGLSQVSQSDRSILADKWIVVPGEEVKQDSLLIKIQDTFGDNIFYALAGFALLIIIILIFRRRNSAISYFKKGEEINKLEAEVSGLEKASSVLEAEIREVKAEEDRLHSKIESLK